MLKLIGVVWMLMSRSCMPQAVRLPRVKSCLSVDGPHSPFHPLFNDSSHLNASSAPSCVSALVVHGYVLVAHASSLLLFSFLIVRNRVQRGWDEKYGDLTILLVKKALDQNN